MCAGDAFVGGDDVEGGVSAADVVVFGLNIIIPFMSSDLLMVLFLIL